MTTLSYCKQVAHVQVSWQEEPWHRGCYWRSASLPRRSILLRHEHQQRWITDQGIQGLHHQAGLGFGQGHHPPTTIFASAALTESAERSRLAHFLGHATAHSCEDGGYEPYHHRPNVRHGWNPDGHARFPSASTACDRHQKLHERVLVSCVPRRAFAIWRT
jgi:hypothetical protein